nr:MAG TPA: hypothetical protein [Caudoviricetes sp.]
MLFIVLIFLAQPRGTPLSFHLSLNILGKKNNMGKE